ncbi:hypothetical protein [Lacticaseibacillus suilingensis]|uniref:hypothetical protein n=1 Tax=Lacticaseibacillus suilingensis TaxID=2799577 RepID=UPI0022E8DAB0|nr:hypothetical protein [Lacticaseibacillus suilingensis]
MEVSEDELERLIDKRIEERARAKRSKQDPTGDFKNRLDDWISSQRPGSRSEYRFYTQGFYSILKIKLGIGGNDGFHYKGQLPMAEKVFEEYKALFERGETK